MKTLAASKASFFLSGVSAQLRKRELINLVLKVKFSARRAPSPYCEAQTSQTWFPVAPGVTILPEGNEPVINEIPLPPNAVAIPDGFDPYNPDLCLLFQDILPVGIDPVYPIEQTTDLLALPFNESIRAKSVIRTSLAVQKLNYALRLEERSASLAARLAIAIITKSLALEAASFVLEFASSAVFNYTRTMKARNAVFVLGRPQAGFLYSRAIIGGKAEFSLAGQPAQLTKTYENLEAQAGSIELNGQDAILTELITLSAEGSAFDLNGQDASLVQSRKLIAATGEFELNGSNAEFTGILARDFGLVEIVEDDLLNLNF